MTEKVSIAITHLTLATQKRCVDYFFCPPLRLLVIDYFIVC